MSRIVHFIFLILMTNQLYGQAELPIFNQRLTNTFIYNPSLAGYYGGNVSLIHKQSKIAEGANFNTDLMQVNTPIFNNNGGIGMKIYMDRFGLSETFSGSIGAAYHINSGSINRFSMGLSGDFYRTQLSGMLTDPVDPDDVSLGDFESKMYYDFSFGMNYRSKYVDIGGSINNIGSFLNLYDSTSALSKYFSIYTNFKFPIAKGRDVIEPLITYRHISTKVEELTDGRIDVGVYYTYNDLISIGGSYGGEGRFAATAGFSFGNFYVGYNFDDIGGENLLKYGSSSEFVLQYNFQKIINSDKFRERRASNPNIIPSKRKSFKSVTGKIRTQSRPKISTKSLSSKKSTKPKYSSRNISLKSLKSNKNVKTHKKMKSRSMKRKKSYYRQNRSRKKLF